MADLELDIKDCRIEFFAVYVLRTLKIRADKWVKMFNMEENEKLIVEFIEKKDNNLLCFTYTGPLSQTHSGSVGNLIPAYELPLNVKAKTIYFIKKEPGTVVAKDQIFKEIFYYGDIAYSPIGQLTAIIDEVKNSVMYWLICLFFWKYLPKNNAL